MANARVDKSSNLHDYFEDTFHQRLVKQSQEQKYDATMLTPATRLLQKQREMSKVEDELKTQKLDHGRKMEQLEGRRKMLEVKEQTLTESLRRFDRFLKENDARRKRALRKTRDEREACLVKDDEIILLADDLANLRTIREKQRKAIAKQEFFERYLKGVLSETEEFSEINELIDRYVTLHLTNKDLVNIDLECQQKMDSEAANHTRRKEEHRVRVLGLNTKLGELTAARETAEKQTLFWEAQATGSEQNATKKTLLLGRIRMATANLYALVNAHAGAGNLERIPGTEKQLEKIQVFIKDLEDVVTDFEREVLGAQADAQGHMVGDSMRKSPGGDAKSDYAQTKPKKRGTVF